MVKVIVDVFKLCFWSREDDVREDVREDANLPPYVVLLQYFADDSCSGKCEGHSFAVEHGAALIVILRPWHALIAFLLWLPGAILWTVGQTSAIPDSVQSSPLTAQT